MNQQIVCVTGADRGVGLALAARLAEQGHIVWAGRYGDSSPALEDLQGRYPEQLHVVSLDVGSDASVRSAAEHIAAGTSRLDMLINNAAVLGDIEATVQDELNFAEMQQVYNVNALGALRMSNALIPLILRGGARLIVNISSEAGSIGDCYRTSWFAYSMSKSALNMQTALIHNQLKAAGGQAVAVHPGWVQTFMRGVKDEQATLTPEQSASHILQTVQQYAREQHDKAQYIDYAGNALPW